jgi:NTE family protein
MSSLALILSGGGARAAYQVGVLRHLAAHHPDLAPSIMTGVSAGAISATFLAARSASFGSSVERLHELWRDVRMAHVFRADAADLASRVARWGLRLVSGGVPGTPQVRSLVDTSPLRALLTQAFEPEPDGEIPNIARNIEAGRLRAIALTASSYTTGQSVTWVQSAAGFRPLGWEGPRRRSISGCLTLNHVMASSALPLFFPAVKIDDGWYGDGGIRLTSPLSPAIHLGAEKIVAVSTRYSRTPEEANRPAVNGYPPPAQVAGILLNAVFLDQFDADAERLEMINRLVDRVPPAERRGMRHIDLLLLRPSQDLGRLANQFEPDLPRAMRFLIRGLGSRETRSNDMLSLLMFQGDYIARLIELGEHDARNRAGDIAAFLEGAPSRDREALRERRV